MDFHTYPGYEKRGEVYHRDPGRIAKTVALAIFVASKLLGEPEIAIVAIIYSFFLVVYYCFFGRIL